VPTYVALISWTDQGVRDFAETTDRAEAADAALRDLGGKLNELYWTLGPYDLIGLAEAPDEETITAWALKVSSLGNIRTTTMRAFDRGEVQGIIEKAG
jgi:uncharacterized protein with GYD domain